MLQDLKDKPVTREWITFENKDQNIFAVLHRPLHVDFPPVVCVLHGFASTKVGSNRGYVYLAEALAKEGIATLRFDFRGSGDSEGVLSDITFDDLVSDASKVISELQKIERIDTARIGIFGSSLGGSVAVLSQVSALFAKALVLWAPVASGELWYRDFLKQNPELKNVDPKAALSTFRGISIHPQFREQFAVMNAARAIEALKIPILHMHGDHDATISLAHQEAFRKLAPSISHFITYPNADHKLGFAKIFPEVVKESISWFKRYL